MGNFVLRTPDELHERLRTRATADGRSLNAEIVHLLVGALNAPPDVIDAYARAGRGEEHQ